MGNGSSTQLLSSDIAFFSQTGTPNAGGIGLTLANCTFENPCGPTDFSQTGVNTLNTLLPDTQMFFNGGSYPALDSTGTDVLTLNAGQSVHSRTADYSSPATGAARSTFNGGFFLTENNQLNNIILLPTPDVTEGIAIDGAINSLIAGSQIGSTANPFIIGIAIASSDNTRIVDSLINTNDFGITVADSSSVDIGGTSINVNGVNEAGFNPIGLFVNDSTISIHDGIINVVNINTMGGSSLPPSGMISLNNATISANNMQVSITNNGSDFASVLTSNFGGSISVAASQLTANGSSVNIVGGSNIEIITSSCVFNGIDVPCS